MKIHLILFMAYLSSFILHVCTVYLNKLNLEQSSG